MCYLTWLFINTYRTYMFESQVHEDEARPTGFEFKTTYSC